MRLSRRTLAALVGLAAGLAGCDSVPAGASSGGTTRGSVLPHDLAFVVFVVGVSIAFGAVVSIARQALVHRRLAAGLAAHARPAAIGGRRVYLVHGTAVALVAGVRHPRTYISPDVTSDLAPAELRAVLDHERHHEHAQAPFRLILLAGVFGPLSFVPGVARLLEASRARLEVEADECALANGARRQAIAAAILKLSRSEMTGHVRGSLGVPFAASADVRLRALLGEPPARHRRWPVDLVVATATFVVAVVGCSLLR